jgi:DNA polymerase-4
MTDLVLYVSIHRLYVSVLEAEQPERRQGPLVVVKDRTVWDVNPIAQKLGVQIGRPITRARVLLGGQGEVHEWREEIYAHAQENWLRVCADHSGWVEPEEQHSAWLDLSTHADPDFVARQCIDRIKERTQLPVSIGYGTSKWTAKALMDSLLPLSELPVHALLPIEEPIRERLAFLGYRTIGQVAELPLNVLQGQFGQEAYRILAAANGLLTHNVEPVYPPKFVQDHLIFANPIDNLEILDRNLLRLSNRVGRRLQSMNVQANSVKVQVETEESERGYERPFTRPIIDARTTYNALRLILREAQFHSVRSIQVMFPSLKPIQHIQPELVMMRNSQTQQRALDEASRRIHQLYGSAAVVKATDIEQPRRKKVLKEWQDALKWS